MTKEITKANILQEIQDKFGLREWEATKFLFNETVMPIYDIDQHVRKWVCIRGRKPIAGNGAVSFFSVPPVERWHVRRLSVFHETGANFDIDQVFFYRGATECQYVFYDTTSPLTSGTVKIFEFPQDIPMEYGELADIRINVSNFVGGGYVALHMLREVETIR